jgi:hypothetical protein
LNSSRDPTEVRLAGSGPNPFSSMRNSTLSRSASAVAEFIRTNISSTSPEKKYEKVGKNDVK